MKKFIYGVIAMALCLSAISCGAQENETDVSESSQAEEHTEATVPETEQPTTVHTHSTHSGKCSCGEYVLDKLYIPSWQDYNECTFYAIVPSKLKEISKDSTSYGFDVTYELSGKELLDDCESFSGRVICAFVDMSAFSDNLDDGSAMISSYTINYVPLDKSELNEAMEAVREEIISRLGQPDGKYGASDSDVWYDSSRSHVLILSGGNNFISIGIQGVV